MPKQTFDAVYQDGAFHLVGAHPHNLEEGHRVQLVFEDTTPNGAEKTNLDFAAQVYVGLSEEEISEVERIAMDRSRFFSEGK